MRIGILGPVVAGLAFAMSPVQGGMVTFTNLEEFLAAAGDVQVIDFETLPDGNPSVEGTPITPEFNYTDLGVTFSSPFPQLTVTNVGGQFGLRALHPKSNQRNWIIAEFVVPVTAVGFLTGGGTTLFAFDEPQSLITSFEFHSSGQVFLGIVSPIPIDAIIADRGSSFESFQVFYFTPIPEPTGILLLASGIVCLFCKRRFS